MENQTIAEDLTAATLERAWQGRSRYNRDLSGFATWVFGIARHVAADHFRRRDKNVPLEYVHAQADECILEETVHQRHQVERLLGLLARLSEREREIVALKYGANFSNREIASLLHLTETNVSTRLHRLVTKLRAEWTDDEPAE